MAVFKQALAVELQRRQELQSIPKFSFDEAAFPMQKTFFRSSKNRFRTAVCSRRSGKTVGIVLDMFDLAQAEEGINILYITITQIAARAIIWDDILKTIDKYKIECKPDNNRLTITFPNKSKIYIAGAKDRVEIERFRGWKIRRCYIDECQSFRSYIKELIDDIIIPALRDLRGELFLTGTPGPVKAGIFYEYSTSDNWDNYHWTAFDNPYMHNPPDKDLELTLAEERVVRGISESDPSYIRETYGKWVEDEDALVFKFNRSLNVFEQRPSEGEWTYVMGVDIGYDDSDAICILGYNSFHKKVYLVDEYVKNKQNISALVEHIQRFRKQYEPVAIVMDAGALGKKIQDEIQVRHGIPMRAAEKARKVEFIELLNDDLRTGKFLAFKGSIFQEDCFLVQWDKDSKIKNPERPKISTTYHSDICDAVLYAWRECRHYLSSAPIDPHPFGSDPYMAELEAKEAAEMEQKRLDPDGYEMERAFESDMDELESLIERW